MRLPRKAQAEPGERHRQHYRDRERPPFEPALSVGAGVLEDQLSAPLVTKENVDDKSFWGNNPK